MTRHASLADQLQALRAYRSRPEPEADLAPVQTNWSVTPANDNNPEDVDDLRYERKRLVTPSVPEIMRQVAADDIERNEAGQIIRIGRLRFSDGTQTENAYRLTIDGDVEQYEARMPTGAMLGCRDKPDVQLGGDGNPQEVSDSNRYFSEMFDTSLPRYKTSGRRRNGPSFTHEERKAMLANAYANTDPAKVTYTRYPAGLPCGSPRVADSFIGMKKARCADSGSLMWADISTALVDRDIWANTVAYLADKDRAVLDVALTAANMAEIGVAGGHSGKTAERRGKKMLLAANDNLRAAMQAAA